MDRNVLDSLVCKWDGRSLQFYPVEDSHDEGLLLCPDYPACDQVYLVTNGVVVALPRELMSKQDQKLLHQRLAALRGEQTHQPSP